MTNKKILRKILQGKKDIGFGEMVALIESYGFSLSRISGSHHIFTNPEVREIINIQNVRGKAKPYQVNQFLRIIERYNLKMEDDE
jgi:predicted RNA binding protein YcfA (HicA-like mRNA interferase family)